MLAFILDRSPLTRPYTHCCCCCCYSGALMVREGMALVQETSSIIIYILFLHMHNFATVSLFLQILLPTFFLLVLELFCSLFSLLRILLLLLFARFGRFVVTPSLRFSVCDPVLTLPPAPTPPAENDHRSHPFMNIPCNYFIRKRGGGGR